MTHAVDLWLIDGFNALHACLLKGRERQGWWRAEAQALVARWLEAFARERTVVIVFDAGRVNSERCSNAGFSATLRFAPDADEEIVRAVRETSAARICVVTADRSLSDRCRALGATTLRPWSFDALLAGATTEVSGGSLGTITEP